MEYYLVKPPTEANANYCIDNSMNLMLSYWADKKSFPKKMLNRIKERKEKGLSTGLLFMDSGAFTAWTKGVKINLNEYIEFINTYGEYIDHFGQIDSIPTSDDYNSLKKSADDTWENYLEMVSRVKYPDKITYTFHVGEPIDNLITALEWGSRHKDVMKMIALGGMVKKNQKTKESLITRAINAIEKYYPEVKIHLFGTTSDSYFYKFPVHSGDSSNYIQSGITRKVTTPYGIISFGSKITKDHYKNLGSRQKELLDDYFKEINIEIEDLYNDSNAVLLANIKYIQKKYYDNKTVKYNNCKRNRFLF